MSILDLLCELSWNKFSDRDYARALVKFLEDDIRLNASRGVEDCMGFFCVVDPEKF